MEKEQQGLEEGLMMKRNHKSLRTIVKKVPNWKTPGHHGRHGFWFKKFTSIHDKLALEMNRYLEETYVLEWMTEGKNHRKRSPKRNRLNNYLPITCLLIMRKTLSAQITEEVYYSPNNRKDATRERGEQAINNTFINTSLRTAKLEVKL